DHFGGIDRAQDTIERHRRNRDDGDAEREADPVPPDPPVAEHRRPMQRIEHSALTILWSRLHRSTRHAIPGNFPHPPYRRCNVRCPIPRRDGPRAGVPSRWPATTSKTRAGARGLALRQVGFVLGLRLSPAGRPPWPALAI